MADRPDYSCHQLQRMSTEHRRPSCSEEETLTISPHECSVKGGERILVTFPSLVPRVDPVYLVFRGSRERHEITTGRHSPTSLYATIPAHQSAEVVDLSVCVLDENGEQRTLYKTQFAYVMDQKQYMAQLLLGSVSEAGSDGYPIFPPLPSTEALREYDQSLTDALEESELPPGWTLVGYNNHNTINSIQDCTNRETLLHFAARHSLNSLAQYLLSLPGAGMAAILPNEQGQLPVDLAREKGNNGLMELLTLFMKQVRPNGLMEDSPLSSPVISPNHETEGGVSLGREEEEETPNQRHGMKRSLEDGEELSKFKEINDQWKSEVKRHKASSLLNNSNFSIHQNSPVPSSPPTILAPGSTISNEVTTSTTTAKLDQSPANTTATSTLHPSSSTGSGSKTFGLQDFHKALVKKKRRSSVAVMSSTLTVPPPVIPLESVDFNVTDPSLAAMNRKRRTSWSYIVGNCDSRSIDTGLNELDRITAEDFLCKRLVDMREGMVDLAKHALHDRNHMNNNQNHLNLLYRLSISCPMLNEADDDGTPSSLATSPAGTVSPFYEEEEEDAEAVPPRSNRSVSRSDTCSSADSQRHLRPTPVIPEVITTEYSDQTSESAEDLLSADDTLDERTQQHSIGRYTKSDSQLVDNDRDNQDASKQQQQSHSDKECRSMSPSLELLDKKERLASLDELDERKKKDSKDQDSDVINLLDAETARMSCSAPDLLSMTSEELKWLQSEGRLNQQSNSTDGLEMESIVEHRILLQQVDSVSPTVDEVTETVMDTSNTSVEDDFVVVTNAHSGDRKMEQKCQEGEEEAGKKDSVSSSPMSQSLHKTDSTSSTSGRSAMPGDRSAKTPTPGGSQRMKAHRRSLSTSEVDVLKDVHKISEGGNELTDGVFPNVAEGWKPMADISEAKSCQSLDTDGLKVGELGGDLDERSRASSLRTNDTFSPHESEESSDDDMDDDFHSAKENISKTSVDPEESNPASDLLQGSDEIAESNNHENGTKEKPNLSLGGVVLRKKNSKGQLSASLPATRYSADLFISGMDDYMEDTDDDLLTPTSLAALSHRRINSTTLPPSSESDYNLRKHLNSTEEQNEGDSASSRTGTSPNMLQDSAVTSPQQKDSARWANDSVFDQKDDVLNASDVDVKLVSDDSVAQSLESSLDNSLSASGKLEPGSSDSIKKRGRKSPLLSRKSTVDRDSPSRRKGLTKEDVEPTIKTLKGLLSQDNIDDNLSDDDLLKESMDRATSVLQRTPSSVSDSSGYNKDDSKQASLPRSPLSPTASVAETECTSLDFVPGSPLALRRQAQLAEQVIPHPQSPLSFYQARSPPGSLQSISSEKKVGSPSSIPSSPSASHKIESEVKLSIGEGKEEDDELTSLKRISEVGVSRHSTKRSLKVQRPATNFDEGAGSQPYSELLNEMSGEVAKEQSEEELSDPKLSCEAVTVPVCKDNEWGIKRVFNRDIFRRSKTSKKVSKVKKSGEAEHILDPSVSMVQKQSLNRPKSAARVHSMRVNRETEQKDDELTFMTPDVYAMYKEQQRQQEIQLHMHSSSSTGLDMQSLGVKSNHVPGHTRSSSLQVSTRSQLMELSTDRQISDDSVMSPKRSQSEGYVLRPVEEELNMLASPTHLGFQTQPSGGESDNEEGLQETEQLVSSIVRNPLLAIPEELSWDKTVNRKLYKKMNKTERDRQSILHELLQTEKRYFRVLHVLKLIFRQTLAKHISEEDLSSMFPELNSLIEISNNFARKLESKNNGMVFEDCSEVLLKQFSGELYERTLEAFGNFCSGHLTAMEIYREHLKKKHFARIMKDLHSLKECQRLTLPDYYTHVIQHLSKILTLLKRLTNKTEALKLDHAPRLRQALQQLEMLMSGVNKTVEYRKNRKELMYIQERLEVANIPKSTKITNRKDLKSLSLVAYDRMLIKSGEATWIGHGKTLTVHVVLVTDLLVLLTERDQKYHLATLQDFKPPVIRLYDLHVRLDAAVKSGVQLLLLEKGPSPEMFRLQFVTKSEAKVWDSTLNSAIEECKKKGLTAEYFGEIGGEKLLSGDEDKRQEGESDQEDVTMSHKKDAPKAVSIQETTITITSSAGAVQRAKDSLELAGRLLTQLSSPSTSTADASSAQRYQGAAASSGLSRPFLRDSPKNRQRSHAGQQVRPKTAYYSEDSEVGGASNSSATMPGEHVITLPIPPGAPFSKSSKQGREKKKVNRSSTFRGAKEKEKDKDKQTSASGGGEGTDSSRVLDQQVAECITKMKEALEEMVATCEEKEEELEYLRKEKDQKIAKLQDEIAHLREVIQLTRNQEDQSPLMSRHNSHSHSHARPHSVHIDLSDRDELVESGESPNELSFRPRLGNMMNKNLNVNSSLRQPNGRDTSYYRQCDDSSSQETENLDVADTGT